MTLRAPSSSRSRRAPRRAAALPPPASRGAGLLALLLAAGALLLGPAPEATAQSVHTDVGPVPAAKDYWLLTEFDWGDERMVVDESIQFAPGFLCYKVRERCQLTRVSVDGEDLLARFSYERGRLTGIAFVTPDLDRAQADAHLARVGEVLTGYVRRFQGEPTRTTGAPEVAALAEDAATPIATWSRPEMEIRVEAGRNGDAYYVGAFFSRPEPDAAPTPGAAKPGGAKAAEAGAAPTPDADAGTAGGS